MRAHRRAVSVVAAAVVVLAAPAWALFTDAPSVASNTFSTATLQPPTNPSAGAGCTLLLAPKIDVSWTATSSPKADGYKVLRSATSGGPYTEVGSVLGLLSMSFTDLNLSLNTTYYYVAHAYYQNWTSANSAQVAATTPLLC